MKIPEKMTLKTILNLVFTSLVILALIYNVLVLCISVLSLVSLFTSMDDYQFGTEVAGFKYYSFTHYTSITVFELILASIGVMSYWSKRMDRKIGLYIAMMLVLVSLLIG